MEGQKEFVQIEPNDLFPYLLVNIGSGVSMIKVHFFFFPDLISFLITLDIFFGKINQASPKG